MAEGVAFHAYQETRHGEEVTSNNRFNPPSG